MGLPFKAIVTSQEILWDALSDRRIAVDAYNSLYQFLATIRQPDGQLFTDSTGRVTSHLVGAFYRVTSLLAQGVHPIWVFDGRPPDLKAGTLRGRTIVKQRAQEAYEEALAAGDLETARRKAAQTSRLTSAMVTETKRLLSALGVPYVDAPSEGEAQAARMATRGQVWAVGSEDYDSLLFGTPRLVRGLAARTRRGEAPAAQYVDRTSLLESLGISDEELLLVGILVGTDYNDGTAGYGPKRALKLAQRHLGWEESLRLAGVNPASVAPVAELFRHPSVADVDVPPEAPVDELAVDELLVQEFGFSSDRVHAAVRRARRGTTRAPIAATDARKRQMSLESFGESSS